MRLVTALALLGACSPGTHQQADEAPAAATSPSVLLFTLDTLRADVLEPYGAKTETPNLAKLAAEGVLFERAYTVTPLTIPAHSSLFTGLYPPRHGVQDNGDHYLGDDALTLAERLQGAGYHTMAAVGAEVTSRHWGFSQGFDDYFDDLSEHREGEKNRWRVERPGDEVIADALTWLRTNDSASPFFAWVHLFDAHFPYEAPEPYSSRHRPYAAEVAWTDSLVGRVMAELDERGVLDDTWVIVVADHGEGLGSHGESQHGTLIYDATTHIPLIVRPPGGLPEGRRISTPVSLVDLTPTIAELAGQPPPTDIDGVSLAPLLRGSVEPDASREVYVESLYAWRHYGWAPQKALVSDTYKLIDSSTDELYARADWAERENLVEAEQAVYTTHLEHLRAMTEAMVRTDGTAAVADASDERMAMLEALGYVTATQELEPSEDPEALPHPRDMLPVLQRVEGVRQALRTKDFALAESRALEVLELDPNLVDVRLSLAQAMMGQGRLDEAIELVTEVEGIHGSATSKTLLASMLVRRKEFLRARQLLTAAVEQDPNFQGAWAGYLPLLQLMGDYETLESASREAAERLPDFALARGMQGVVQLARGERDGIELVQQALDEDPKVAGLRTILGAALLKRGEANEAEAQLLEEVSLHPPALRARRLLVAIYAEQQRYAEQLEQLEVVARFEPPNVLTAHSRAQVLFNLKRFEDAQAAVTRCRKLAPSYARCALLEANIALKLGDEERARALHAEANELAAQTKTAAP